MNENLNHPKVKKVINQTNKNQNGAFCEKKIVI